mmetsp:Transcript_31141/g.77507  ORF Transcript_31141/g.77507 Transcript_31141/m.77507 type:complete len:392 (+) Transcript_31141:217-1392(+)|eukprot:CAMPEP_0197591206 /NCGR_PEP_ID=MMETSP1326-20131121/12941_1 /TAXON_ID=1155430 /ORGANISM="Genus nov. species nov., Strain RCC2288" /LENGTH=391 /DNA_ID=CAMNT_0043156591 /DNA_START=193 /DNA_END=1368 /DNA_ORIENTATION=+
MGVKAETTRRLRASVFLVVVGLLVGSLMGYAVTPHDPGVPPAAGAGADTHHSHGFLSNIHMPWSHDHHDEHEEPDEDHHEAGAHGDGDAAPARHEDAHDSDTHDEEAHPAPSAPMNNNKYVQSGKQSWANPEHRETYKAMYNEYHKLRSGANVCHSCRFLEGLFKIYSFKSSLDAGCGTAVMVRKMRQAGVDARGIEAASLPLEEYAKDLLLNGTVFSVPMQEIPFETARFDLITSVEVFEHIPEADVDRSINELSRVAKPGANAFITVGQSTSRFDTPEGRKKSAVAAISTKFKFHETVKPRQWWIDTFCAHGFYEDPKAYMTMVKMANDGGLSRPPPRGWLALVKGKPGSQACKCTVPPGRQGNWFCGVGRPNAKRDVAKLWAELRASA